jgi:L-ascorbate metabolism protein UlaG (beta-lactamase superfamily)
MPEPVNRTALFDPGAMSEAVFNVDALEYLNDIFITHEHGDHTSVSFIKKLVAKFPQVSITVPESVVAQLAAEGIAASSAAPEGVELFESPHERVRPYFDEDAPAEHGYHYLDMLSAPGDSHSFTETKAILALPVTAPWGSVRDAVELALKLKPQHVIPVHDWHWSDAARESSYENMENVFSAAGITFHKMKTGEPIVIDL